MPEMDGSELIEHIKKLSPETPAILFSGKIRIYERSTAPTSFCPKGCSIPWS